LHHVAENRREMLSIGFRIEAESAIPGVRVNAVKVAGPESDANSVTQQADFSLSIHRLGE